MTRSSPLDDSTVVTRFRVMDVYNPLARSGSSAFSESAARSFTRGWFTHDHRLAPSIWLPWIGWHHGFHTAFGGCLAFLGSLESLGGLSHARVTRSDSLSIIG